MEKEGRVPAPMPEYRSAGCSLAFRAAVHGSSLPSKPGMSDLCGSLGDGNRQDLGFKFSVRELKASASVPPSVKWDGNTVALSSGWITEPE